MLTQPIDHSLDITELQEGLRPQLANDPARKIDVLGDISGYLLSFFQSEVQQCSTNEHPGLSPSVIYNHGHISLELSTLSKLTFDILASRRCQEEYYIFCLRSLVTKDPGGCSAEVESYINADYISQSSYGVLALQPSEACMGYASPHFAPLAPWSCKLL